jgi:hypothetical protein
MEVAIEIANETVIENLFCCYSVILFCYCSKTANQFAVFSKLICRNQQMVARLKHETS